MHGLDQLEKQAADVGLILRLQVRRPLNLWVFRLVVAEAIGEDKVQLLGEMKGWAYSGISGLHLDTMKVDPKASIKVGSLIWAATMAWAIESTPCRKARLLAIRDDERRHASLLRYFRRRGFQIVREVGSSPMDLPLRMVWGGSGTLMIVECRELFQRTFDLWLASH